MNSQKKAVSSFKNIQKMEGVPGQFKKRSIVTGCNIKVVCGGVKCTAEINITIPY